MTSAVVCDASALVGMLLDAGPDGQWATVALADRDLMAPHLVEFECSNIIRRSELAGHVGRDQAAQAHADLVALPIERWPYDIVAPRVWELRANLTSYDASCVAVAELTGTELITLDRRIARVPQVRCPVRTPGRDPG